MSGIYIHIPFCKQACHYCNFYFTTSQASKEKFVGALLKEIEDTKNYLQSDKIKTLYFGGGTPSLLNKNEWHLILEKLFAVYDFSGLQEFTIETNPDDLSDERIEDLKSLTAFGLNRFSIGVQSFFDEDLKYMNRAHNAEHALASIKKVQDAGFENITIDLIYGTPTMNDERWLQNIETAFSLQVPHISSYALTVEPKTSLETKIRKGTSKAVDEEQSAGQFAILIKQMKANGFEQYEISNFARDKKYAIHNSNYWFGKKYLGLGPSAHSFNGNSRRWNVANNITYLNGIENGTPIFDEETLTHAQKINERIMTSLRTQWGLNMSNLGSVGEEQIQNNLQLIDSTHYTLHAGVLKLTTEGKFFADRIAANLFIDELE
jgi:oxygen-independent coproporphyrinogen-3 oxidase